MINRLEKFKLKASEIHYNKYNYNESFYYGCNKKIKILCPDHGIFEQTPHHHITRKQGCPKCRYINISISQRYDINEFIDKAKRVHGDKYDYSLVQYVNRKTKVKIICSEHGIFEQVPDNHLNGQTCGKCCGLNKTNNEIINEVKKVHGDKYDYSLVQYVDRKTKIKIICPKHGIFEQLSYAHSFGQGCPKCHGLNKTNDDFIKDAILVHGDKYDYSLVNYIKSKSKIKIICPKHGIFEQIPNMHLRNNGCPVCRESKGEKEIRILLISKSIKFIRQFTFKDCKNTLTLPFDFYLPEHNICIEYDGIQHFKPVNTFGGNKGFEKIKINDNIKTNYCFDNEIKLIRIPYNKIIKDYLVF